MNNLSKKSLARALLIPLTIAGLISIYQVAFDIWMAAYRMLMLISGSSAFGFD